MDPLLRGLGLEAPSGKEPLEEFLGLPSPSLSFLDQGLETPEGLSTFPSRLSFNFISHYSP